MSGLLLRYQRQLDLFQRQYFQLQVAITYPDPQCLRQEVVQRLLEERVFNEASVEYQPPQRYQIRVLKELTRRIEASITDWDEEGISDGLVSRLSVLLALPLPSEVVSAQQKSYVTYTLSSLSQGSLIPTITLLEARNLLAATGATGFRTWEACLHLGAYLSSPSCAISIANRNVLELGAGTGYLSILCAKHLNATHVTVTDGSEAIVSDLPTNFYLNGLQESNVIEAQELKWGQALPGREQAEWNQGRPVNVVLGADITYDSAVIPSLVATLVDLVEISPAVEILIAATIRNEETFKTFQRVCDMNGFAVKDINFPVPPPENQEGPFYSDKVVKVPIRLCNVKKIKL